MVHSSIDARSAVEERARTRLKVLHVLATVGRGGVETWLCNLLSHVDQSKFQFDVCFYRRSDEEMKDCLVSLASQIIEIPLKNDFDGLLRFIAHLREVIRRGKYQVVHCHGMSFVGVALYCAWREHVPIRIAHSHGTTEPARPLVHKALLSLSKHAAQYLATHRIGCCTEAAEALFGRGSLGRGASVLYCGVDLD